MGGVCDGWVLGERNRLSLGNVYSLGVVRAAQSRAEHLGMWSDCLPAANRPGEFQRQRKGMWSYCLPAVNRPGEVQQQRKEERQAWQRSHLVAAIGITVLTEDALPSLQMNVCITWHQRLAEGRPSQQSTRPHLHPHHHDTNVHNTVLCYQTPVLAQRPLLLRREISLFCVSYFLINNRHHYFTYPVASISVGIRKHAKS